MSNTAPLISSRDLVEQNQGDDFSIPWLLEKLFPAESIIMVAGAPGSLKTFFSLCCEDSFILSNSLNATGLSAIRWHLYNSDRGLNHFSAAVHNST